MKIYHSICIVAWLAFSAPCCSWALTLNEATTNLPVIVATNANKELRAAAGELVACLSNRCGAVLALVDDDGRTNGPAIHIGQTAFVKQQDLKLDTLDLEGFHFRSGVDYLILAGRSQVGTRHAVYAFLEKYGGMRWFFPGELGTYCPAKSALVLEKIDERDQPAFLARYFTVHDMRGEATQRWEHRNRVQDHWTVRLKGNSHAMAGIIPAKVYGKEHPEYYALVKGKRAVPGDKLPEGRASYCFSNPELVEICAKWVIGHYDKHPEATGVHVGMNDSGIICECEPCAAAGVVGATNGPNFSDRYFGFVNKVAESVAKKYPQKTVGVMAYGPCQQMPNIIKKLAPNVNLYVVAGGPGANMDPEYKQKRRDLIKRWTDFSPGVCIYQYQFGGMNGRFYQIPVFYPHFVAEDLLEQYRWGVKGSVTEMLPIWFFSPRAWMMAKLLWNPEQSADDLLATACQKMFGKGAGAMRKYFDTLEKAWLASNPKKRTSNNDAQFDIIKPYFSELDALSAQALDQAQGAEEKARVRYYADGLRLVQLLAHSVEIAGGFSPFPGDARQFFRSLKGAGELGDNERLLETHQALALEKYGIGRAATQARDKKYIVADTIWNCASWLRKNGYATQAEALTNAPAAGFGADPNYAKISTGSPQARPPQTVLPSKMEGEAVLSRQQNGVKTLNLAPFGTDPAPVQPEGSMANQPAVAAVLKMEKEIVAARTHQESGGEKAGTAVSYVDRSETALKAGATLLLRESFDDEEGIGKNDGEVYGAVRFEPGIRNAGAYLGSKDAIIAYPVERLNPLGGAIEFFFKTDWAGRDENLTAFLFCTAGNFDPPGNISIRIMGEPGKRNLWFTVYAVGTISHTTIPLKDWREDAWHHVAAMWNVDPEKPEANLLSLYLDGQPAKSVDFSKAKEVKLTGTFGIANRPAYLEKIMMYPMLTVDELRIYDRPVPESAFSFSGPGLSTNSVPGN